MMSPWSKAYIALFIITVTIGLLCMVISIVLNYCVPSNRTGFVTTKCLGQQGRFGNQLFQVSSTVGLAQALNKRIILPEWPFLKKFENSSHIITIDDNVQYTNTVTIQETSCFEFDDNITDLYNHKNAQIDVNGFRQNTRYFNHITYLIRKLLRIKTDIKQFILEKYPCLNQKVIGVHVRRGDYVNSPVYEVCTKDYYSKGISFFQDKHQELLPVIFVSDDIEWCKATFKNDHYQFAQLKNDFEDFVCLNMCSYKVISNSTFAWWSSFLDARFDSQVMAPEPWLNMSSEIMHGYQNLYQDNWHIYHITTDTIEPSNKLPIEIGGYYQCFKQPYAFVNVLQAYREIYPSASLVIVSDAGDDFSKAASYFHSKSYTTNSKRGGNGFTTNMTDGIKLKEFIQNFLLGARKIDQNYFILLEDDVMFSHAVYIDENLLQDITGMNEPSVLLNNKLLERIKQFTNFSGPAYVTGCGGSIFRTSFWNKLNWVEVEKQLDFFISCKIGFHADIALSFICYMNNGKTVCGQTLTPHDMTETKPKLGISRCPAILHQFKDFYNKDLTDNETRILLWNNRNTML